MRSVRIYNQNCVLAGQVAPASAPDDDVTEYHSTPEDLAIAMSWANLDAKSPNDLFKKRVGKVVLEVLS